MPSKAWDWTKSTDGFWKEPAMEVYYLEHRWSEMGFRRFLDIGCGLGRHSLFFAEHGFDVTAFDLSDKAVDALRSEAESKRLDVDVSVQDMHSLSYPDESFDCAIAYYVVSHTDSEGSRKVIGEIRRVLRSGGEAYITMCSKDARSFIEHTGRMLDENTIVSDEDGPEKGIPHFYASMEDVLDLLDGFEIIGIRHTDDFVRESVEIGKHYYIHMRKV